MCIPFVSLIFLHRFCIPTSHERQEWVVGHGTSWCVSAMQEKGVSATSWVPQPGSRSRGLARIFHNSPSHLLDSAQTVLITHQYLVGAERWVPAWGRAAAVMAGGSCRMQLCQMVQKCFEKLSHRNSMTFWINSAIIWLYNDSHRSFKIYIYIYLCWTMCFLP